MALYDNAVDQVKGMRQPDLVVFRLAEVSSLSNGRAYVQFYGESSASTKLYPYIEGYKPTVGDKVLMIAQGDTFIIAGKISKDNITDNYYLTKGAADSTYLTEAQADEKYEPIGGADPYRLVKGNYHFWLTSDGCLKGNQQVSPYKAVTLGESGTLPFGQVFTEGITLGSGGKILAYSNNSELGSTSKLFKYGYFDTLGDPAIGTCIQQLNARNMTIYGTSIAVNNTNSVNVGTSSKQLNNVYAKQFYQNGTAISTSDKRKKTGIKGITKKYVEFFRKLRPVLFRFKDGESGRLHSGFIAQEVEQAAGEAGIESKDLAFLCIDQDGNYGLRYEELIALQTQIIQDLLVRVEILEGRSKT